MQDKLAHKDNKRQGKAGRKKLGGEAAGWEEELLFSVCRPKRPQPQSQAQAYKTGALLPR